MRTRDYFTIKNTKTSCGRYGHFFFFLHFCIIFLIFFQFNHVDYYEQLKNQYNNFRQIIFFFLKNRKTNVFIILGIYQWCTIIMGLPLSVSLFFGDDFIDIMFNICHCQTAYLVYRFTGGDRLINDLNFIIFIFVMIYNYEFKNHTFFFSLLYF